MEGWSTPSFLNGGPGTLVLTGEAWAGCSCISSGGVGCLRRHKPWLNKDPTHSSQPNNSALNTHIEECLLLLSVVLTCIGRCVFMHVFSCMFIAVKQQLVQPQAAVIRATWGTLKANMVVGADVATGLFLVDAPETFLQTGVDHLPGVCCCHPVCCASLHGCGPRTNSLSVIETDGLQALIVSVPPRMVNVEPRRPLCHAWRYTEGSHG